MKKPLLIFAGALLIAGCAKLSDAQITEPLVKIADNIESLSFNRLGECLTEASFELNCNYDWKAVSNADWATIDVKEGKAGHVQKIKVTVSPNVKDARNCQVNIFDKDMLTKTTIEIVQDGMVFFVDTNTINIPFVDSVAVIDVVTDTKWTAEITGEGFTLDKTSGEGNDELTIKTAVNLAGLGGAKKTAKVVVKTLADIKVKEYEVNLTQSSGYCFYIDDLTRANVKGHNYSSATAKIDYVGTQAANGKAPEKASGYVVPDGTSSKRRKNVLDWYEYGTNGPRFGIATGGSTSYYYEFKSASLTFSFGSTSTTATPSRFIFPIFKGYRVYRVEILVPTAGKTIAIGTNESGYSEEIKPAQSKMVWVGDPKTNAAANETLVWDVSAGTKKDVTYYTIHRTTSCVYKSIKIYYGE